MFRSKRFDFLRTLLRGEAVLCFTFWINLILPLPDYEIQYLNRRHTPIYYLQRFITQRVYIKCTRTNYKIVPVTNLNKYLH